eukprot:CAMPEP_0174840622 /NCGR_PEP_ID=MMETSP1114-20130205/8798_1 /TAXON_ID=312471 /ORGANISM="Neobodo designis, Strain CCAP 1951/1" /LENGTH=217 /DNA_ID=CAMNT_0016074779 /DNA_START=94 /DNA_END=743 /DNA_ORIENTATION=+
MAVAAVACMSMWVGVNAPIIIGRRLVRRVICKHARGLRVVDGSIKPPSPELAQSYDAAGIKAVAVRPVYEDASNLEVTEEEGGDPFAAREADRSDAARERILAEQRVLWQQALDAQPIYSGAAVKFGVVEEFPTANRAETGALHDTITAVDDADARELVKEVCDAVADDGVLIVSDFGWGRGVMFAALKKLNTMMPTLLDKHVTAADVSDMAPQGTR